MARGSRSCRLFLKVDLCPALPALYSDGFMEHSYTVIKTILCKFFMSKAILKMVSLLVELTKYVLCCKTLLLARIKAFFQIPIPVYTMTCTVYTFPQTLATVYRGCAREKVKLFKKRQYLPEPLVIYVQCSIYQCSCL